MAYAFIESRIMGKQSIASAASTAAVPVGTIVRAKDPTYGEGEFIYLRNSLASIVANSLVTWYTKSTGSVVVAMTPNTTLNALQLAVAQVAGLAGTYAWFQITGTCPIKKVASLATINAKVYLGATTGRVRALTSTGRAILGMRSAGSTSATVSTWLCTFHRPHLIGN